MSPSSHRYGLSDVDMTIVAKKLCGGALDGPDYFVTLHDLAGHGIFSCIQQLFLAQIGVYVVVFDMEQILNPDPSTQPSCLQDLSNWINIVTMCTRQGTVMAPVCLVGTRKDLVSSLREHKQISELLNDTFSKTYFAWPFIIENKRENLMFFPVDCSIYGTSSDCGIPSLLTAVESEIRTSPLLKVHSPLNWLKTLDGMFELNQPLVPLGTVKGIAFANGVREYQIAEMLSFFQSMGIILWIQESEFPDLHEIVILDPIRHVAQAATHIICDHQIHNRDIHEKCMRLYKDDYDELLRRGVASEELLLFLLSSSDEDSRKLLSVLAQCNLVLPCSSASSSPASSKLSALSTRGFSLNEIHDVWKTRYMVPAMLPESDEVLTDAPWVETCESSDWAEDAAAITSFYLLPALSQELFTYVLSEKELQDRCFMPNGLFERFLCEAMAWCQSSSDLRLRDSLLHRNRCVLKFGNVTFCMTHRPLHNCVQVDVAEKTALTVHGRLQTILRKLIRGKSANSQPNLVCATYLCHESATTGKRYFYPLTQLQHIKPGASTTLKIHNAATNNSEVHFSYDAIVTKFPWVTDDMKSEGGSSAADIFVSFSWNDDSQFVIDLLDRLLDYVVPGVGRMVHVRGERERIRDRDKARQAQFSAMQRSSLVVPVISEKLLDSLRAHFGSEARDGNDFLDSLLLEWLCATLLIQLRPCFPTLISTRKICPILLTTEGDGNKKNLVSFATRMNRAALPSRIQRLAVDLLASNGLTLDASEKMRFEALSLRGVIEPIILEDSAIIVNVGAVANGPAVLSSCAEKVVNLLFCHAEDDDVDGLSLPFKASLSPGKLSNAGSMSPSKRQLLDYSVAEMGQLLQTWDLHLYVEPFRANCVSGETLAVFQASDPEMLMTRLREMRVNINLSHSKQLYRRLAAFQQDDSSPLKSLSSEMPTISHSVSAMNLHNVSPVARKMSLSQSAPDLSSMYIHVPAEEYTIKATRIDVVQHPDYRANSRVIRGKFQDTRNKVVDCAVKRAIHDDEIPMLLREMDIFESLSGITCVVDVFFKSSVATLTKKPYFVMEYFGENLSRALNVDCPKQTCERLALKLINCIESLHSQGIMHGDLKPQNILYRHHNNDFEVKLCDLDSAAVVGTDPFPFKDAAFKYTPGYECPEFLANHAHAGQPGKLKASFLLDYFTLGLVLWQLFNNAHESPFAGADAAYLRLLLTNEGELEEKLHRFKYCTTMSEFVLKLCKLDPSRRMLDHSIVNRAFSGVTVYRQAAEAANTEIQFLRSQLEKKLDNLHVSVSDAVKTTIGECMKSGLASAGGNNLDAIARLIADSNEQMRTAINSNRVSQTADILLTLKESLVGTVLSSTGTSSEAASALDKKLSEIMQYMKENSSNQRETAELVLSSLQQLEKDVAEVKQDIKCLKDHMVGFGDNIRKLVANDSKMTATLDKLSSDLYIMSEDSLFRHKEITTTMSALQTSMATLPNIEAVNVIRDQLSAQLASQQTMLSTLIQGTHSVPTLIVIFPDIPAGLTAWDPRKFVQDRYRLFFLCGHTLRAVSCGPEGTGYLISAPKEWVKKAAPILNAGLSLLKVGLALYGIPVPIPGFLKLDEFPFPLPGMNDLMKSLDKDFKQADSYVAQIRSAISGLKDGDEESSLLGTVGNNCDSDPLASATPEATRAAYAAIKSIMEAHDPSLKHSGLRFVTDTVSGISEWIADDDAVENSFRAHRGARQPADNGSVTKSTSPPARSGVAVSSAGRGLFSNWMNGNKK
jgi:serine/threonine protein kinase